MKLRMVGQALIVVDVQEDFVFGSMAVPQGEAVVVAANKLVAKFERANLPIYFTACQHPKDHCSFKAQGGPWTEHCVIGTTGALIVPWRPLESVIIAKGTHCDKDAYSGFDGTGLHSLLQLGMITDLFVCGIATEYCVKATVLDAAKLDYQVTLISDAIAAVDEAPDGAGQRALAEMYANERNVRARTERWIEN